MIKIEHINKSFGKQQVLKDVCLEIPAGQVVGLLGPNGAGKSTLMKILIGLWTADSGQVSVPARIGYLPENNPLYEEMYVTEYLCFMAKLTANSQQQTASVDTLIDKVLMDTGLVLHSNFLAIATFPETSLTIVQHLVKIPVSTT